MKPTHVRLGGVLALALFAGTLGCGRGHPPRGDGPPRDGAGDAAGVASRARSEPPPEIPIPTRPALAALGDGEVYVYEGRAAPGATAPGATTSGAAAKTTFAEAAARGLLVVDLSDAWAPFIFQDGGSDQRDPAKPNGYRRTFVALANDRIDADGRPLGAGEANFLEAFGIPPTLSALRARVEADRAPARRACEADVDWDGVRAFTGSTGYIDREHARREHAEAGRDADWLQKEIARREESARVAAAAADAGARHDAGADADAAIVPSPRDAAPPATWKPGDRAAAIAALQHDADAKVSRRVARTLRGQERVRAVRAVQAFLQCEGLLSPRAKTTPGSFDLPTHEALAAWERRNDIFGWGLLGGETQSALPRPTLELDYETFRRVLAERVADAAGIVEDGSATGHDGPATFVDAEGHTQPVPNVIEDHVRALLDAIQVTGPGDMIAFLRQHGDAGLASLRVAFRAPPLPPYYEAGGHEAMELSAEIDRGDVWYDFPFDAKGRPIEQHRARYPHLTLFVTWRGQRIPLLSWRTTIGSWRSELHANGKIYYKYKNSDVGNRVWKDIVAGPVWIPPDSTPVKDLLTRKVRERDKGPQTVVNTDVMGPGFQSAYGLVMAIHVDRGGFDNQIRTHGSVDYTSIARRFSHGCHRLVNDRAVRLFDFILRRRAFHRIGDVPLHMKRNFAVDGVDYSYALATRGYYYELAKPLPVTVTEGRIMGKLKKPIADYVRKAGVDYEDVEDAGAEGEAPPAMARKASVRRRAADPSSPDTAATAAAIGGSEVTATPGDEAAPPPSSTLGP